jgi:uncharacterized protein YdhG (YjbR/CyaY superfamily)
MTSNRRSGKATGSGGKSQGLAEGERDAIRARVKELRPGKANGEADVMAAIAKMPEPYRTLSERLHALVTASAPVLSPKTWYGLPAYAKDGKVVCYLRMNPKAPYNDRYLTFGFNEAAKLDRGNVWPVAFAVTELTAADEEMIGALVKQAVI